MGLVDEFMSRYEREMDFYDQAGRLCRQQCQEALEHNGIRAIVTSRAKGLARLREKIEQRKQTRECKTVDDIYQHIVDLAGVRIALYFPGDRDEVGKIIESSFDIERVKQFPEARTSSESIPRRKFSGYCATHYIVGLRPGGLAETQQRYRQVRIEIQVASLLMHAWSEVDHDLAYKPVTGQLSIDEYAALDQLNGIVLAGEASLEALQRALKTRVSSSPGRFRNHYELASFLYDATRPLIKPGSEPTMGRADILLRFLELAGLANSRSLTRFLKDPIDMDTRASPIVEQVVDRIVAGDERLYALYSQARGEAGYANPYSSSEEHAGTDTLGRFMAHWVAFETALREIQRATSGSKRPLPTAVLLRTLDFADDDIPTVLAVANLRNSVVHGVEPVQPQQLLAAQTALETMLSKWSERVPDALKPVVSKALRTMRGEG
jgi:ppGpp synthetase/RelA/SpoT-type nucleotidyltranferase